MSSDALERALRGDASRLPEVITLLANAPDPGVRIRAAECLGERGDRDAIPALEDALFDRETIETRSDERSVGQAAEAALEHLYGRLGRTEEDVERTVLLWSAVPVNHLLVLLVRSFGAAAGDSLVRLFGLVDAEHRESAAFLLAECAYAPAFDVLIKGVRFDMIDRVSVACAHALGVLARPEALSALLSALVGRAPKVDRTVLLAVQRCCTREQRLELAIAYASHRWNDLDGAQILEVLSPLYDGRMWTIGESLWAHLLERHGPVHDATKLTGETWESLVSEGRVFWIKATRDGHGGGDVSFVVAKPGSGRSLDLGPSASARPYVLSSSRLDIAPWLAMLDRNGWERILDVPGANPPDPIAVLVRARDGDPSCAGELVEMLRTHPEAGYRFDAARYLGRLGGREAIAALERALADGTTLLLSHDDFTVAQGAFEGLRGIYRRIGATPDDARRTVWCWVSSAHEHLPSLLVRDLGELAAAPLLEIYTSVPASHRRSAVGLIAHALAPGKVGVARAVWTQLLEWCGPVRHASDLEPEELAAAIAKERVFWIRTTREGKGKVTFHLAREGASISLRSVPMETAEAFVFTNETVEMGAWLAQLSPNEWTSAGAVPGLSAASGPGLSPRPPTE